MNSESIDVKISNVMNRMNSVITEGKALLNKKGVPYDNESGFDSILNGIRNYPNYKTIPESMRYKWMEPTFIKDGVNYYIDNDPIVDIAAYESGYICLLNSGATFYSNTGLIFTYAGEFEVTEGLESSPYGNLLVLPSYPFSTIDGDVVSKCTAMVTGNKLICGINGNIVSRVFDETISSMQLVGTYATDTDFGWVLMISSSNRLYQVCVNVDEATNEKSIIIDLDKSYDTTITNVVTKRMSVCMNDRYASKTVTAIAYGDKIDIVSRIDATDDTPCNFLTISGCAGRKVALFDGKLVSYNETKITVFRPIDNYIPHEIKISLDENDEIVKIEEASNGLLCIFTIAGMYIFKSLANADMGFIPYPHTIEILTKIIVFRDMIFIEDSAFKLFSMSVSSSVATNVSTKMGSVSLDPINGDIVFGDGGSSIRGLSWSEEISRNGAKIHDSKLGFNPLTTNGGFIYGDGIGVYYPPGSGTYEAVRYNTGSKFVSSLLTIDEEFCVYNGENFVVFSKLTDANDSFKLRYGAMDRDMKEVSIPLSFLSENAIGVLKEITGTVRTSNDNIIISGKTAEKLCVMTKDFTIFDLYLDTPSSATDISFAHIETFWNTTYIDYSYILNGVKYQRMVIGELKCCYGVTGVYSLWEKYHIFTVTDVPADYMARFVTNGSTILLVGYTADETCPNGHKVGFISKCNNSLISIKQHNHTAIDESFGGYESYDDTSRWFIGVCGSMFISIGNIAMISPDGVYWNPVSNIDFVHGKGMQGGTVNCGMLGEMCVIVASTSDGSIVKTSGNMDYMNTGFYMYEGIFDSSSYYKALDFIPSMVVMVIDGAEPTFLIASTKPLFTDGETDVYNISSIDGKIVNDNTYNKVFMSANRIYAVSSKIMEGTKYTILAFN